MRRLFFVPSVVLLALALLAGTCLAATSSGIEWPVSSGGNGHRYQNFAGPATWDQANAAAEAAGGHLATATSPAENAFIAGLVPPGTESWIGGILQPSGGWMWVTGEAFAYTNWADGEGGIAGEDRMAMFNVSNHVLGTWLDIPGAAFAETLGYVVEYRVKTIGEAAADLAKAVAGTHYYTWGAKGWNYSSSAGASRYLNADEVPNFYTYFNQDADGFDLGRGLDCSGLILWAYNKAFGATVHQGAGAFNNPVGYESADGQFMYNTVEISEADLMPGDLLFFCCKPPPNELTIKHVAMFVGPTEVTTPFGGTEIFDVVQAANMVDGIKWDKLEDLRAQHPFFGRLVTPQIGIGFLGHSPIRLVVTDPDGFTLGPGSIIRTDSEILHEVSRVLYGSVSSIDLYGRPDEVVTVPVLKEGTYTVRAMPRPGVVPNDTYSLEAIVGQAIIRFAENVPISDIPLMGYRIRVSGSDVTPFTPVDIDVKPGDASNSINPRSKGVIPVAILTLGTFDALNVDWTTIRFGRSGTEAAPLRHTFEDVNADGKVDMVLHFPTKESGIVCGDVAAHLIGKTFDGNHLEGSDIIRTVGCR